jgi:hypothetical protein
MLFAAVLCIAALLSVSGMGSLFSPENSSHARWAAISACLLGGALYFYLYYWRVFTKQYDHPFEDVPPEQARRLQELAGESTLADSRQAAAFALAVTRPASIRRRITETYEPARRTLRQRVAIELQFPRRLIDPRPSRQVSQNSAPVEQGATAEASAAEVRDYFFIPVLIPQKGELLDSLTVYEEDGRSALRLSYQESLVLAAKTLRLLLASAYRLKDNVHLPQEAITAELQAVEAIVKRRKSKSGPIDMGVADTIEQLAAPNPHALRLAASFVRRLVNHYAIVVVVQKAPRYRWIITYERTLVPQLSLSRFPAQPTAWFKNILRIPLGARPVDLSVSLENAWTTQGYHLLVNGPDDLYLGRQRPIDLEPYLNRKGTDAPTRPHYRFRSRLGQPYAHFYTRFFTEPALNDPTPELRFTFFEVPPGSLFRANVAAAACFALIATVGFVYSSTGQVNTDAPAFLLAFPAVAATWLGFDAPSRRLLEGTLIARLSLLCTALTSVAAASLFIQYKSGPTRFSWRLEDNMHLFGVHQADWFVLVLVALVNLLITSAMYLARCIVFTKLAGREVELSNAKQHG